MFDGVDGNDAVDRIGSKGEELSQRLAHLSRGLCISPPTRSLLGSGLGMIATSSDIKNRSFYNLHGKSTITTMGVNTQAIEKSPTAVLGAEYLDYSPTIGL